MSMLSREMNTTTTTMRKHELVLFVRRTTAMLLISSIRFRTAADAAFVFHALSPHSLHPSVSARSPPVLFRERGYLAMNPPHHNNDNDESDIGAVYRSTLFDTPDQWQEFTSSLSQQGVAKGNNNDNSNHPDPFWEQVKMEAENALALEPQAGPQLYQGILSQPTLLSAICTVVSHEIETELIPATTLKNLFMDVLSSSSSSSHPQDNNNNNSDNDEFCIRQDLQAVATRSHTVSHAMDALLFHNGFHALVCHRVSHRLWQAGRRDLAHYLQSTVSRVYSADIHPACEIGHGCYVRVGAGVVIGETAVVGNDVSVLEGVTLGGSGKEAGDRHPKVGNGVIVQDGGTVLGNIPVGEGAVVTAKCIVTKPVPPLAIVSGIPGKVKSYRDLKDTAAFDDDLQRHLAVKYLDRWQNLYQAEDPAV